MPPPHDLDSLLGYHLRRASSVMMADLAERLSELGLRTTEASVLVVLDAESLITQSEIGRRLAIKRANMAPLMAGLVGRGLVQRADPSGRAHPLRLSRKGKALADAARRHMAENDADFFGMLADDDRIRIRETLAALWRDRAV